MSHLALETLTVDAHYQAKIKTFINEHPEYRKELYIDNATKEALESGIREGKIEQVKSLIDEAARIIKCRLK